MRYFALLVLLAGCGGADRLMGPSDYACSNTELAPGAAFRIEYAPVATYKDGILTPVALDTTARIVNRYLDPHHSADTVFTLGNHGEGVAIIFHNAATYCLTVFDSLTDHLPNAQSYVVVP